MALAPDAWVPLAEVARPHGVRGELRLRPFNQDSDLLLARDEVLVRSRGGERVLRVQRARRANDAILMKLESIDDRSNGEGLRGAHVCVRRGDFPPPGEGEFYVCDLEGARVVLERTDGSPGRELGRVREVRAYPAADVLLVDSVDGGVRWEVPLVAEIVRDVDVAAGLVRLATLEGVERGADGGAETGGGKG